MFRIISYNFAIAIEALVQNKTRALLTSLGIICGVASVIAMLAIGKGAQEAIIEKMKLLGTNNIVVTPINLKDKNKKNDEEKDKSKKDQAKRFTPGLTLKDAESIKEVIPNISAVSPEVLVEMLAVRKGFHKNINLVGILPDYFKINPTAFREGANFSKIQMNKSAAVCIIGSSISSKLFALDNPIGQRVKCGKNWLTCVGVLKNKSITQDNIKNLGIRNYNEDIYIPISTMLLRYVNRSLVTKKDIGGSTYGYIIISTGGQQKSDDNNYHQLDRIIVQVKDNKYIKATAEIISRMLNRRHNKVVDYKITIPELLLQQEQSTRRIFNIVLGAIASISLLVGGIGIMNIMLASVLERTREIGVRRAVGAKQHDILVQFLIEAVTISLSGGVIGIISGIGLSYAISYATNIITVISGLSVFVSFIVSISVGLIFGIAPARKASFEDPILLLRYE